MASPTENETEEVVERIFKYLWQCDSCVFYLKTYLASSAGRAELEHYEGRNWSLLKITGTVGFFENHKKLYYDMCDFLNERLYDIWPADNLKDRSFIAKLNLIYWILLPEALRYGLQQELDVTESEAKKIVIYGYEYHLAGRTNGKTPLTNTPPLKCNEEQSQISNSVNLSNLDANVTPSSSLLSEENILVPVKSFPTMDSSNTSYLHLLQNAEPIYIDGGDNVNASISGGERSPLPSPVSVTEQFGKKRRSYSSAVRICPLSTPSEASMQSPLVHPEKLYKYSNDGQYLSNLAVVRSKNNTDPQPTPTGTKKRLLSTVELHKQLRNKIRGPFRRQSVDQQHPVDIVCLEKGGDDNVVEDSDALLRLGRGGVGKVRFMLTKALTAEETNEIFMREFVPLRKMAGNRAISYYFATRIGNSRRTQRKLDGAAPGLELIALSKINKALYLVPMYDLELMAYPEEARALEQHDECGICHERIPISEIISHVATHRNSTSSQVKTITGSNNESDEE